MNTTQSYIAETLDCLRVDVHHLLQQSVDKISALLIGNKLGKRKLQQFVLVRLQSASSFATTLLHQ
jgi:hypothetical protein